MTPPTTTNVVADDDVMDFSSRRRSLRFRVDDDVFDAAIDIAAELALDYAAKVELLNADDNEVNTEQQKEIIHELFRMVLLPESADRFIARLSDRERPIGQQKIAAITKWLFEEYGLRPTEPDSA